MRVNVSRLRYWFAAATIAAILVVAGFYFYARYRFYRAVNEIPQKLGVEVQQSTEHFSLSKSEGGRTIFTIRASKAVQYKQGGRAELKDVSILVYGRDSDRFDQIYGSKFEYDPQSGNVTAEGEVQIDLEANAVGQIATSKVPPPELKNPIHVKTSGLVFNQKSGIAKTNEVVEFRIPQASGSALGATYDSKTNALTLISDVKLDTTGDSAASIRARRGVLTKEPRRAVLQGVQAKRGPASLAANTVTVVLRQDNAVDHIFADGNVLINATGQTDLTARAPQAELSTTGKNLLQSAVLHGGVIINTEGAHMMTGTAERVAMDFGPASQLSRVRASGGVRLLQKASARQASVAISSGHNVRMVNAALESSPAIVRSAQSRKGAANQDDIELTADAIDFYVRGGKQLDRAETAGPARIAIVPNQPSATQTVITADKFLAGFDRNRLSSIHGAPNARVVQSAPGQANRVTTSDMLDAAVGADGSIDGFVQQGNFQYREGDPGTKNNRTATAQKAVYNNGTQVLTIEGSPRVVEGGMSTTAQIIRFSRRTGEVEADRDVKTTYTELQPQANGAMLASSDPVHVTAAKMTASRSTGVARFSGDARLWQAANIVQAPIIVFDRDRRSVQAEGNPRQQVSTALVQQDKNGKITPVSITAARLTYQDKQRRVRFEGGVLVRSSEGTMSADHIDVFLKPPDPAVAAASKRLDTTPSRLEKIVADGRVVVQQPTRRATGNTLVYTADNGKFVLTGGPPSITDAERGTVTGASLTFYSRDDRVLVEGGDQGRTVTTTRVSK